MLSKAEEIKILSAAIAKLGPDSYLGPELARLIPWIEMEIRSDICPDLHSQVEISKKLVADNDAKLRELEAKLAPLNQSIKDKERELFSLDRHINEAHSRAIHALEELRSLCRA